MGQDDRKSTNAKIVNDNFYFVPLKFCCNIQVEHSWFIRLFTIWYQIENCGRFAANHELAMYTRKRIQIYKPM